MSQHAIIEAARRYVGVRFRHQGRSAQGVDCLGLLVCVSHDLGLAWSDALMEKMQENNYSHFPDEAYLRDSIALFLRPSQHGLPQAGEVALMRIAGRTQHLGIIAMQAGITTLIHAYAPARRVVEHRLDDFWQGTIVQRYVLTQA